MLKFGKDVHIESGVTINVTDGFIGDRSIIRSGVRIEGNSVILGRESYLDHGALIGGGSCFDTCAFLNAGDWLHMGWNSQINIARGVCIGDEVGIGIETKILTHGAYLPIDYGFPVQWGKVKIGNRVWLPHAWVNPGVTIGNDVVVTAMSLVNTNLESGCLYGGIPVKKIKSNVYPKLDVSGYTLLENQIPFKVQKKGECFLIAVYDVAVFNLTYRTINGRVTLDTIFVQNQLRRNGIRFKYAVKDGVYVPWQEY